MPPRLPEPGETPHFEHVQVGLHQLVRLSRFPRTEPYYSRGQFRFDGPGAGEPGSFGTCYLGLGLDVAFAESVIHDASWWHDGQYEIPSRQLRARHVVTLHRMAADTATDDVGSSLHDEARTPVVTLADFTADALKRLGLNNDISAGDDYTVSMAWARAVHASDARCDGILYVSRQMNGGKAVALFERGGAGLEASHRPMTDTELAGLCTRFSVAEV